MGRRQRLRGHWAGAVIYTLGHTHGKGRGWRENHRKVEKKFAFHFHTSLKPFERNRHDGMILIFFSVIIILQKKKTNKILLDTTNDNQLLLGKSG